MPSRLVCPHCGTDLTAADLEAARFDSYVNRSAECWEWTGGRTGANYGAFTSGRKRYALAHRWQWTRHHGPIPAGMQVLHRCDNPPCVRPDHLWLGTPLDNMRDKIAKGRGRAMPSYVRGERHGMAKLTAEQVAALRAERAAGAPYSVLMARYGVSKTTVGKIANRKSWRED